MFKKGQIVTLTTSSFGAAMAGAIAQVTKDQTEGYPYVDVLWFETPKRRGQNNGGYNPEDFRLAYRDEVQEAHNVVEKQLESLRDMLRNMPIFRVGDFVYRDNGIHFQFPWKVLEISNGHAFLARPGEEPISVPANKLIRRPSNEAHIPNKDKYPS